MKTTATIIAALGLAAGTAIAGGTTYNGAGGGIPDNGEDIGDVFSSTLNVGDVGAMTDLDVSIDIAHTWIGDLIITISHGADSVVLSNRLGVEPGDTVGWSWNLNGVYTFDDAAGSAFADTGEPGSGFDLPGGSYAPENALALFNGADVSGDWTLTISDGAGFDVGSVASWSIHATVIPAPSAMALLGLGGLVAGRRRR